MPYLGAWFCTLNQASADTPVPRPQSEAPVAALRVTGVTTSGSHECGRLSTVISGGEAPHTERNSHPDTRQTGSRLGGAFAYPFSKHQSLKISYSAGTYIRLGGNYRNVQVAWQYSWLGLPKMNQKKEGLRSPSAWASDPIIAREQGANGNSLYLS